MAAIKAASSGAQRLSKRRIVPLSQRQRPLKEVAPSSATSAPSSPPLVSTSTPSCTPERRSDESGENPSVAAVTATDAEGPESPPNVEFIDIVQFDSAIYYVQEEEGYLKLDVIRMGTFTETSTVDFRTEDGSAQAGYRYETTEGTLVFEPGCVLKTISIPIIDNEGWDTTLEFKIRLLNPVNCELGRYLYLSRVKVIDGDYFPSNTYKKEFDQYGCTGEAFKKAGVTPAMLLVEFFRLVLRDDKVRQISLGTLIIDQMQNLYFLFTTYAVQYAADDILGAANTDNLLVPGSKVDSLVALAFLYLVPFAVLNFLDLWKAGQQLKEDARGYLQISVFRKYLNFDELSRVSISSSEFSLTIISDADDVISSGFMQALELLKALGKLVVSLYFISAESADALLPTMFVAVAIGSFIVFNYETNAQLREQVSQRQAAVAQVAQDTSAQIQFISDFKIRPVMEERLESGIKELNEASVPLTTSYTVNEYFPSWLANVLVAGYLALGGQSVIQGDIQIGAFLATVNIFKGISDTFKDIFTASLEVSRATAPAVKITELMNKQTNVRALKDVNRNRRAMTRKARSPESLEKLRKSTGQQYVSDAIPIELVDLSFQYPGPSAACLRNTSLSVAQGTLVAVCGPPLGGKSTLIKLLGGVLDPTGGLVFMPSYLRVLHVCAEPIMMQGSIWRNLTIGCNMYWTQPQEEVERAVRICERIGLSDRIVKLLRETQSQFLAGEESTSGSWRRTLSISEQVLLHIARAFVYNPEVLVMNRPTSQLPEDTASKVFTLMREFVDNRGVELPSGSKLKRRPRTGFISFARMSGVMTADVIWVVDQGCVREVPKENVSSELLM